MDWMIIDMSIEEELSQETLCREIQNCTDEQSIKDLCISLLKQNWHQGKLLNQAVKHIAQGENSLAILDR